MSIVVDETVAAMRAGGVWQPRPWPGKCSACGGLRFLYCKIQAGPNAYFPGLMYDAVQRCACLGPIRTDETKGKKSDA